ncbi:hypothetical protein, partial [Fusobacterium necrophorum]|uniref:hypothetical protein n=1 Tax=Fusobacterium necrophorum TaxID=859 RepID=UPI000A8AC119
RFLKKFDYEKIFFSFQDEKEDFEIEIQRRENQELIQKNNGNIEEERFQCIIFDSFEYRALRLC